MRKYKLIRFEPANTNCRVRKFRFLETKIHESDQFERLRNRRMVFQKIPTEQPSGANTGSIPKCCTDGCGVNKEFGPPRGFWGPYSGQNALARLHGCSDLRDEQMLSKSWPKEGTNLPENQILAGFSSSPQHREEPCISVL